jgi:hypothetical protein
VDEFLIIATRLNCLIRFSWGFGIKVLHMPKRTEPAACGLVAVTSSSGVLLGH